MKDAAPMRGGQTNGLGPGHDDEPAQGITVVGCVGHNCADRARCGASKQSVCGQSLAWPGVRIQLSTLPAPSQLRWSLGVRPPRLRPMAWGLFLAAPAACWWTRMLVESSCIWRWRAWGTRQRQRQKIFSLCAVQPYNNQPFPILPEHKKTLTNARVFFMLGKDWNP
ncbi:hypothetical protein GCM10022406_12330 [Hymenobacter algoricola]|uniref:Uncharacterized protein n=1 Tax=Hymenobacter algoricola TaxID=486267 RepID=A0ABP7MTF6_9BACT